ncbi:hypothetical protein B0H66DRAFT_603599 [Apodospora peruviana]|uniref:2EXR domain-containing protein n=1 Tax=Apodospora peruviana TaxID=516989 RepID=A0AAE0I5W7_9PEZI|nr:hypothetical protein B0H66DRAFT_603599 [Apodospora peruviana]
MANSMEERSIVAENTCQEFLTTVPATEFKDFPNLPAEVRHQIWKDECLSAPPCLVAIFETTLGTRPNLAYMAFFQSNDGTFCQPADLRPRFRQRFATRISEVNREARSEAITMKSINILGEFWGHGWRTDGVTGNPPARQYIYINFTRDMLFLTDPAEIGNIDWGSHYNFFFGLMQSISAVSYREQIQNLALTLDFEEPPPYLTHYKKLLTQAEMEKLFRRLPALKRLWFVLRIWDLEETPPNNEENLTREEQQQADLRAEPLNRLARGIHSPERYTGERLDYGFLPCDPATILDNSDDQNIATQMEVTKEILERARTAATNTGRNLNKVDIRLVIEPTSSLWNDSQYGPKFLLPATWGH